MTYIKRSAAIGGEGGGESPIGTIAPWSDNTPPTGWLECNGQAIARTLYNKLFTLIGTTYGVGDNSSTFNLPDFRGRVAVGLDASSVHITGATTIGISGGEQNHTLTIPEMPSHNHINGTYKYLSRITGNNTALGGDNSPTQPDINAVAEMLSAGNNVPHNNMQPYMVVMYIIKVSSSNPDNGVVIAGGNGLNFIASDWMSDPVGLVIEADDNPLYSATTKSANTVRWRRVGDSAEIEYEFRQTNDTEPFSAGTGTYLFKLPTGLIADSQKVQFNTSAVQSVGIVGHGTAQRNDGGDAGKTTCTMYDDTHFQMWLVAPGGDAAVGSTSYSLAGLGNGVIKYAIKVTVPIAGWTAYGETFQDYNYGTAFRLAETYPMSCVNTVTSTILPTQLGQYSAYKLSPSINYNYDTGNGSAFTTTSSDGIKFETTLGVSKYRGKIVLFVGVNKNIKVQWYGGAGRTGKISAVADDFAVGGDRRYPCGYHESYDPGTGLLAIAWCGVVTSANGVTIYSVKSENGLKITTIPYFDVLISENSLFLNTPVINAPVGAIMPWAGSVSPNSWLECDGSAVSRTDFSTLFATIGTTYGSGNGSTTFNIPDLRGRVPVGVDSTSAHITGATTIGIGGGEQNHTLTIPEMPSHNHNQSGNTTYSKVTGSGDGGQGESGGVASYDLQTNGSDSPHNNMQPFLTVKYIIKAVPGESVTATNYEVNQKQLAKAWVNFNGATAPYTSIRSSYNIASITFISNATYRVNFLVPMVDVNYCVFATGGNNVRDDNLITSGEFSTTSFQITSYDINTSNGVQEKDMQVTIVVFGN